MLRKIPTSNMSKEEWTKLRSSTIGGSDAAAILGLNPHKSPYALWAEKTGKVVPERGRPAWHGLGGLCGPPVHGENRQEGSP